jgi:PleD family two-component response regulator
MKKILFADDDKAMREMVSDALASAGHHVRAVPDGRTALLEVRANPPDLALLDYRMGDPDGFEVCRSIKSDPQLEHLPVLILTAESDVEDRIRGFAAGANDYLPKPFDARELLARVRALLVLSEQARGLNPSTGLPGGTLIKREFDHRRALGKPFALCYLDLENFKSFNDRFGFARANALIEHIGADLRAVVSGTGRFAGHIGGDDFVVMCEQEAARGVMEDVQRKLREALVHYVPAELVERGSYLCRLRNGEEERIPLTRLTAVILQVDPATSPPLPELGEMAAAGKSHAKYAAESPIIEVEISD